MGNGSELSTSASISLQLISYYLFNCRRLRASWPTLAWPRETWEDCLQWPLRCLKLAASDDFTPAEMAAPAPHICKDCSLGFEQALPGGTDFLCKALANGTIDLTVYRSLVCTLAPVLVGWSQAFC
jgi:hypothetical protein